MQLISFKKLDWKFEDSTLEMMKWIAIISMLVDHVNSFILYALGMHKYELFQFGRLAAPLFFIMLGYNLARKPSQADPDGFRRVKRVIKHTFIFGMVTLPIHYLLLPSDFFLINVMFTFMVAAIIIYMLKRVKRATHIAFKLSWVCIIAIFFGLFGHLPEFSFPGVGLIVISFGLFSVSHPAARVFMVLLLLSAINSLHTVNYSHAALLSLLVVIPALFIKVRPFPRTPRYFFYALYPAHLLLILTFNTLFEVGAIEDDAFQSSVPE